VVRFGLNNRGGFASRPVPLGRRPRAFSLIDSHELCSRIGSRKRIANCLQCWSHVVSKLDTRRRYPVKLQSYLVRSEAKPVSGFYSLRLFLNPCAKRG
jgi:hypothetical protein